ncbi:MAG: translation initiation factor IF-2, partial [Oscillospiraceae bacterium]|nr:translation initiation factor IF-2 [Oscillospiraceae bacterium]
MNVKYKITALSKDLKVPTKDILAMFPESAAKKLSSSLNEDELNTVFEILTKKYAVDNLDAYFSAKKKPSAPKPQPKTAAKPAAAADTKKPAAQKTEKQPAKPEKQSVKTDKQPQKAVKQPQKTDNKQPRPVVRPAARKSFQERFSAENQTIAQNKPKKDEKILKPKKDERKPKIIIPSTIQNDTSTVTSDSDVNRSFRRVDIRASNVDLDKYNEKYDRIAPVVNDNSIIKKQKINQKSAQKGKPLYSRKEQEAMKLKKMELERQRRQKLEITLPEEITVGDLAAKLKIQSVEIIKRLMANGVMATINQTIDYDTAALVAMDIGAKVEKEVVVTIEDRLIDESEDVSDNLYPRDPVVVVMGHVDHGKTSILDAIRHTHVTDGEAGGITQHIGAYRVNIKGQYITFLDTPGHEAFTSMRARGAQITDIAILVVAADDGIMPQTVEAINHAKAANVSIIVAINKIDKPTANPDKVKQELTEYGLVPEEWGGDVICVPVSAKTHENLDTLLEMILLAAEVKELKANPDRLAKGVIIEAKLDKGRGPVATALVQNGTLKLGDIVIAGSCVGKIRVMLDDTGKRITSAGPSVPVEITGLDDVPSAGDSFNAVSDERLARELADQRKFNAKEEQFQSVQKVTLDNLFSQITEGEIKELPIVVKADEVPMRLPCTCLPVQAEAPASLSCDPQGSCQRH